MIDLFGIKARQETQDHLRVIKKLKEELQQKNMLIEIQSQKIEYLKNEVTWFGNDLDFPNSKK